MTILSKKQLYVKEKSFKIFNQFEIYDEKNKLVGNAKEAKKFLKKVTGRYELDVYDDAKMILRIKKPFHVIKPKAYVYDEKNKLLGYFTKKIVALRPRFYLYNSKDQQIGMLEGDFIAWSFDLVDEKKKLVLDVSKKFSGIMREYFTTADSYMLRFYDSTMIDRRIALAVPFMVDLLIKEKSNNKGFRSF